MSSFPWRRGRRTQLPTCSRGGPAETYDFVVGADGVHSAVRRALLPADDLRRSLMTAASWRFTAPPTPGWTAGRCGPGPKAPSVPVGAEHVYGYASATRGGDAGDDPRWLEATFGGFPEPVAGTIGAVLDAGDELYYSPVEEVRCQRWSRGRLVLAGDAYEPLRTPVAQALAGG